MIGVACRFAAEYIFKFDTVLMSCASLYACSKLCCADKRGVSCCGAAECVCECVIVLVLQMEVKCMEHESTILQLRSESQNNASLKAENLRLADELQIQTNQVCCPRVVSWPQPSSEV